MQRRQVLRLGIAIVSVAGMAWMLRACYGLFVNKEDQPAADSLVVALEKYKASKGAYPPNLDALVPQYISALPVPRQFGSIGYAPTHDGRGCLLGYFTHRDYLEEYDCAAKAWTTAEYDDSLLVKAPAVQWLRGPR